MRSNWAKFRIWPKVRLYGVKLGQISNLTKSSHIKPLIEAWHQLFKKRTFEVILSHLRSETTLRSNKAKLRILTEVMKLYCKFKLLGPVFSKTYFWVHSGSKGENKLIKAKFHQKSLFFIILLIYVQKLRKKRSFEFSQKFFREPISYQLERYSASRSSAVKRHIGPIPNYFVWPFNCQI